MTSAQRVLNVARSQLGTREGAGGTNPYGAAYGMDKVAWCAQFQWWTFGQAGASALIPKTAYTPTLFNWYRARGLTGSRPRPGALVFYNWPGDGVDRIQHVGIVEAVNADGTITTIEGNTSSGTAGSQSNGGGVYRRRRATTAVVGYAYPQYSDAPAPSPQPSPVPGPGRVLSNVSEATQRAVHVHVDRDWGPATERAVNLVRSAINGQFPEGVRATQVVVGTGVDGAWGDKSTKALTATITRLQLAWGVDNRTGPGVWGPRTEAGWSAARAANYRP